MQNIKCPECGFEIELTEALAKQNEKSLRKKITAEVNKKTKELDRESDFLKKRAEELRLEKQQIDEKQIQSNTEYYLL